MKWNNFFFFSFNRVKRMPQHVRHQRERENYQQPQTISQRISGMVQHIRSSPKQMIGTMIVILLLLVVALAAAHYMSYITLPEMMGKFIPRKAPAQHLQYFFF